MMEPSADVRLSAITRALADLAVDGSRDLDGYVTQADVHWLTGEVRRLMPLTELVSAAEASKLLGIKPQSVRHLMRRHGIAEARGYPRKLVAELKRRSPGRRPAKPVASGSP